MYMPNPVKYHKILDALQTLLENQELQNISVSEIAHTAGIGKGSIYYYFPSKDAILQALVERNYEKPLQTAKALAYQTEISPFTRMAMIFQACRNSSSEFLKSEDSTDSSTQAKIFLHQKYVNHIITELKPVLAEIIRGLLVSAAKKPEESTVYDMYYEYEEPRSSSTWTTFSK